MKNLMMIVLAVLVMNGCDLTETPAYVENVVETPAYVENDVEAPAYVESVVLLSTDKSISTRTIDLEYSTYYSDGSVVSNTETFEAINVGENEFTITVEGVESNAVVITFNDWELVGSWSRASVFVTITYIFNEDGTGSKGDENFEWSTNRDQLTMTYTATGYSETPKYSIDTNILTLTNIDTNNSAEFTRTN